jgi:hypothetical protein
MTYDASLNVNTTLLRYWLLSSDDVCEDKMALNGHTFYLI